MQNAEIIKNGKKSEVTLGSTVNLKTGRKSITYTIVGPVEADPIEGKISDKSPIGSALFGKKVGEKAVINTVKGDISYEIVGIC